MGMMTSPIQTELEEIFTHYPDRRSALLPVLHLVQARDGWVSREAMVDVGELLGLSPAQVYEVVSFYKLFNLQPVGTHLIQVCRSLPCALRGAERLMRHLETRLGIRRGETTSDRLFTIRTCECLASCGTAPAAQINEDYHESLTEERLDTLLDGFRRTSSGSRHA